jgi:hypothetical protein
MLILKKLRFNYIGRFVSMQEIDFTCLGNLIQVDGLNKNTGGSSGAAKSTVLNAIEFNLGLNSLPVSKLQSRLTDEHIFVEGEYDYDGVPLVITRSKKLKIDLNGEIVTGSSKLTEEKLDQILGIPRHLLALMLYKRQGEKGFFLGFKPSEMNNFLTDCMGLGDYRAKILNLDIHIDTLINKISKTKTGIETNQAALDGSRKTMAALGKPPEKEVDQNAIIILKNASEAANTILEALLKEQTVVENEFVLQSTPKMLAFDNSIYNELNKEITSLKDRQTQLRMNIKDLEGEAAEAIHILANDRAEALAGIKMGQTSKEKAVELSKEIMKLRRNQCPRCEQPWITDMVAKDEARLLQEIRQLVQLIRDGEKSQEDLKDLEGQIAELKSAKIGEDVKLQIDLLEKEIGEKNSSILVESQRETEHNKANSTAQAFFNATLKELRNKHAHESNAARGQADVARRALETAAMQLKSFVEADKKYKYSVDKFNELEAVYVEADKKLQDDLKRETTRLCMMEELKRALKTYLSCSFDEALESISERATKMIQSIPNMQNATIELRGTWETKDGKVREEVNTLVHMDGEENIPMETLSGGEHASVDIAIDLAVLNFVEERANKGINVYLMDEPFNGLEDVNISMVLEVLKSANSHKKLLLTDHNPIVKEQISDRIMVVRDGLTSTLT